MKAHALTADEVLDRLATRRDGLTGEEARNRLESDGRNRLPDPEKESLLRRVGRHFNDVLIYVLLAAAAVTALLGHWVDTAVILGVVVINAVIGYVQEGKAEEALAGIRTMLSLDAQVRRDGGWARVDAEELVRGDVVRLRSGDRVPADLRLLETTNVQIEESPLTGESVPVEKQTDPVAEEAGVGDRTSMAFSGSLVTAGRGLGVVTGTGEDTEIGRISTMIGEVESLATPLIRQMNQFGKQLSVAILLLAAVMFGIGLLVHGDPVGDGLLAAISFAVAAIPEGLPAVMTITLAIGVQRMARRSAITRKLTAVETLGSVTVICSDKTGTLTRNEMTVQAVVTGGGRYEVTGVGYAPDGEILLDDAAVPPQERRDLMALVEAMSVANDSDVTRTQSGWVLTGEPTEGAVQTLALKCGFDRGGYERRSEVPFESEHKFMATLSCTADGGAVVLVKGAPDRLLDRCTTDLRGDRESDLDRGWWEERIDELSGRGFRVLAAARRDGAGRESLEVGDLDEGLVFLGVVGILDPPRAEAVEAIRACQEAGIAVKMITGDHPGTALAIAREMGIAGHEEGAVTGTQLERATDDELAELARTSSVFARTSPEHKLRLVTALQGSGHVVAMTGDGVNDAPSLKRADVGVAMGIKGTEATKEAAEVVLADDNFASIERAVEEGRTIYDNLRKSIQFILPTNGGEALVVMAAVIGGFTLPMTPTQILWVNMVTAVTLALALAFERPEAGVMSRPPRDPRAPMLDGYAVWRIGYVSGLMGGATIAVFLLMEQTAASLAESRTLAVTTLVVAEAFYLFSSRFLRTPGYRLRTLTTNPAVWVAVGVLLLLHLGFVYLPFMQAIFDTVALSPQSWAIPVAVGVAVFVTVELEKAVMRRRGRAPAAALRDR